MKSKNDFLVEFFKRRKINFLRGFFGFVGVIFLFLLFFSFSENKDDYIAELSLNEIILNNNDLLNHLEEIENDQKLKAILLIVNSPGGTVVGSQKLYQKLKNIGKKIPIAVSMQEIAASGGYMVSLAGEKIFCHMGTITGSIGVILQTASIKQFLEKIGVEPIVIKSGNMKAVPNPLEKVDENNKKEIYKIVDDMYNQFLDLVIKSRNLNSASIEAISTGAIFTGSQAKKINLVDEIGDKSDALDWLKQKANLPKEIQIEKINKKKDIYDFLNFFNPEPLSKFNGFLALWTPSYE